MPNLNPREAIAAVAVALPVLAMLLMAVALAYLRVKVSTASRRHPRRSRRRIGLVACNALVGLAFLPLSIIYRPSLLEVAKAQIRQEEDVDEDESGDPEFPLKHLLRQLRRIRRGEMVEGLSLRLK
jgi:predicted PurR-regulated permease PerM